MSNVLILRERVLEIVALIFIIIHNHGQVNCITFSPDGEFIASAGNNGTICLWNLEGELINTFEGHQDKVWSITFSADGKLLVSGANDGEVKLWDVNNLTLLATWKNDHAVYKVDFRPYMKLTKNSSSFALIVSAGQLPLIYFHNIELNEIYILEGHKNIINCVIFSPDGKLLASCSDDLTIKIWNRRHRKLIRTLEGHTNCVNAIAFHPDAKSLVSASSDLTLRLWDIEGNFINVFEGHTNSISSVAFHPNGDIIASGSRDGTVRLWNLQGVCLDVLSNEHQTNVRTVAFNPQGTILACGGEAQPIYLYSQESIKYKDEGEFKTLTFDVATIEIKETDTFEFDIVTIVPKAQINNRPKLEDIYFREDPFSPVTTRTNIRYQSYQELSSNEREDIDYRIRYRQSSSDVVIVAPHGGKIEPGSTEIADAIAGEDYAFYTLEAIKQGSGNYSLSIPSHKFDEPQALNLISKASRVIVIYGSVGAYDEMIYLGGLNNKLKDQIKQSLEKADFTKIDDDNITFKGTKSQNICNRGKTRQGVQIGISWGLRKKLFDSLKSEDSNDPTLWDRFIQAIRDALSPLEAAGWRYQTTKGEAEYYTEELGNGVGLDMISIPRGSFMMGAPKGKSESYDNERPEHEVHISSFFMGRYPITQEQWRIVADWEQVERELDPDPSDFKEDYKGIDRWTRPVENISWEDAVEFCARLSKKTNKKYRLPTEAEWEYACRARTNTPFHFGEIISNEIANYSGSIYGKGVEGEYRGQTTPVGYFKVANAFGLYDMHGNVWEWCEDDLHNNYEGAPTDGSAWLSKISSMKVLRGCSWYSGPYCGSAYRYFKTRAFRFNHIGFRVVCVCVAPI